MGVFGTSKRAKRMYTGVNGAARRVKKCYVGGGCYGRSDQPSAVVDAYDDTLTRTTIEELSEARYELAATSIGKYALFAGGHIPYLSETSGETTAVDAYNI